MTDSPFDQCACGDLRFAHRLGGGCNIPDCWCEKYRPWRTEAEYAAANPEHYATLDDLKRHLSRPS